MKAILIIPVFFLLVLFPSCATRRDGCGDWKDVQKHDKKRFRVMGTHKNKDGSTTVFLRRFQKTIEKTYACLPDSMQIGKYVIL